MQIVSLITDHRIVDRILRHRESERRKAKDPFEPRAPTPAFGNNAQRRLARVVSGFRPGARSLEACPSACSTLRGKRETRGMQ